MSEASKRSEKQKRAIEKPKLDIARKLGGICFIDPADEEFMEIMKNACSKLEVLMQAAMPCRTRHEEYRETCSLEKKCKTKYACIVEADESTRKRMELFIKVMKITGRGINSLSHYDLVHRFIPTPQALKNFQMQKQQWIKYGKNLKRCRHAG